MGCEPNIIFYLIAQGVKTLSDVILWSSMRRRQALQSLAALPILPQVAQAQPAPENEYPVLAAESTESAANAVHRFFTAEQFSTLKRLGELLMPAYAGRPGAVEAEAAEFLDFLLSQSPADRQTLYRGGLDKLNAGSQQQHRKPFAALSPEEAAPLLTALKAPWTYNAPKDALANFLREVKMDVFRATVNSREMAQAQAGGRRRATGMNPYWHIID